MELKLARRNYTLNSVLCATKSKMWLISQTKTPIRLRLRWLMVGRTDWEASHTHISLLLFFFSFCCSRTYMQTDRNLFGDDGFHQPNTQHTHTHIHITTQAHISYIASIGAICYAQTAWRTADSKEPNPISYHRIHFWTRCAGCHT